MSLISFTRLMAVIAVLSSTQVLLTSGPIAAQERIPNEIFYSTSVIDTAEDGFLGASFLGATDPEVRDALDLIPADIVSISFGTSDPIGFEVFDTAATLFPTMGSDYLVMSTGATAFALTANTTGDTSTELAGLNTEEGEDLVQIVLVLQPPPGATCLAFDFAFYSEEFPEWVGSEYNDVFLAEIGESNFQEVDQQIIAPNNFAFDTQGNVVSINTVFGVTAADSDGTTYDAGTPLLTAKTPLEDSEDEITITLSIMDLGDSIWDSTVFIDHFRWLYGVACEPGADADADRDALLDGWETNGIDFNNDGTVDLDLPAMGADPMHKDAFIEIDYMVLSGATGHSHKPKANALQAVIDAFNNAPVNNPDGTNGIRLHIDAGPNTIMNPVTNQTWGTLSESNVLAHQNNLGTCNAGAYNWSAFDAIKGVGVPGNFKIERGDVFHYCIFAHDICPAKSGTSGISRDLPASDFIVSLGRWTANTGTVNEQAGTLMHEFGHNLSLKHGGDDHNRFEPNYLSIMNYFFQTRGLRINGVDGNFDYSSFQLPLLDENSLDETVGLSGVAAAANYGTRYFDPNANQIVVNNINGPIDWNNDGDGGADINVSVDINGTTAGICCGASCATSSQAPCLNNAGCVVGENCLIGIWGFGYCSISGWACFNDGHCSGVGDACQVLTQLDNTDNWDEIVFNGGAVGALGEAVELPVEVDNPAVIDITMEEDSAIPTDLKVSVVGPVTVFLAAGKFATYQYMITNIGDNAETFEVSATATQTWADLSDLPAMVALDPGESAIVAIPVSIPGGTLSGSTDLLTVTAHSTANPLMMDAAETTTIVSIAVIDIKPGSNVNPVNADAKIIPVAILGSETFDVNDVDVTTLLFGPGEASPAHKVGGHPQDVNDDGFTDLVSHYRTAEAVVSGVTELCLTGETINGTPFGDCDPITLVP